MKKNRRKGGASCLKNYRNRIVSVCFFLLFVLCVIWLAARCGIRVQTKNELRELAAVKGETITTSPCTEAVPTPIQASSEGPPPKTVLPQYQELSQENSDLIGWVRIDDTPIDLPVMYTPNDGEYYLKHTFDKKPGSYGIPFLDARCSLDPRSTNLIVYGHNMEDDSLFSRLPAYAKKEFWMEHPHISFDTLYENEKYEIFAAFYSEVFQREDDVFKYYQFINAFSLEEYEDTISEIRALSLYDTGIVPQYGEQLLTLSTCSYHKKNGRFAVIARKIEN